MVRGSWALACVLGLAATVAAQSAYVPQRVFSSATGRFVDFETLLADVARADVVFAGEPADGQNTHRVELALLEGVARRRGEVILTLEVFGRDAQEPLDHFQMGHLDEAGFLASAQHPPSYARGYKPLVDFAVGKTWPIIAANVPEEIADAVTASGLEALKARPEPEKAWFARDVRCPNEGREFLRFVETRTAEAANASPDATPLSSIQNAYAARCVQNETMAESIAQSYMTGAMGGKRPLVVSLNGAADSDFGDGVVDRTRRRLPDKRLLVLSILPVADLDQLAPDADIRRRADYLIFTIGN